MLFGLSGTAFMNAVFYGIKQETGIESEAGCSNKEQNTCSSTGTIALPTRKHVLQVSTYQVKLKCFKNFKNLHSFNPDVRFDALQQPGTFDIRGNPAGIGHPREGLDSCSSVAINGQTSAALTAPNAKNKRN